MILKKILTFLLLGTLILSCALLNEDEGSKAKDKDVEQIETFSISYNGNGASKGDIPKDHKNYEKGSSIIVKENSGNLEKEGYIFKCWNSTQSGDGTDYTPGDTITVNSNITLYAKWAEIKGYTITFETDSGSPVSSINIMGGEKITEPEIPTKAGFNFASWYKDKELTTQWNFSKDIVDSDTTLYARWTTLPVYKVEFYTQKGPDGYLFLTQRVVEGEKALRPETPRLEGLALDYWEKENVNYPGWNFNSDLVTKDTKLFGSWWSIPDLRVTFNSNMGSAVAYQDVPYNGKIKKPNDPTRKNFTFTGWYKDIALTTLWDFENNYVTNDEILYAGWDSTVQTYKVNFESDGKLISSLTVLDGTKVNKPLDPSKNKHNFKYWYFINSSVEVEWDFDFDTVSSDITLYAKYEPYYLVTYYLNGATSGDVENDNSKYESGSKAQILSYKIEPSKPGYLFKCWNTKEDGTGEEYYQGDEYTVGNADLKLFVQWYSQSDLYSVGDIGPSGGYIFYDAGDWSKGFRYLEAAPEDIKQKPYGSFRKSTWARDNSIGAGLENTQKMIAKDPDSDTAATACVGYSVDNNGITYDDWFLPSHEELKKMYFNLHSKGLGGFGNWDYWSSTEADWEFGGLMEFDQTEHIGMRVTYKLDTLDVRPARRF